jgi:CheY-like chemotaxis protein
MRILFVDDCAKERMEASEELSDHDIVTVCSIRSAVDVAREKPFDLVMIDLHAPPASVVDAVELVQAAGGAKMLIVSGLHRGLEGESYSEIASSVAKGQPIMSASAIERIKKDGRLEDRARALYVEIVGDLQDCKDILSCDSK